VALIGFADRQVAWITEFTDDREHFFRRLEVQEGYGQTALHDAVAAAPGLVEDAVRGRRALVLFTDGIDNASSLSIAEAVTVARRVNLPVYAMGFQSHVDPRAAVDPNAGTDLAVLQRIATETGGRLFLVDDPQDLAAAAEVLASELRHQYVIGYYPTRRGGPGRFHAVRLELKDRRLSARTRSGYVTTPTP
jgi:Ca-activated chloride channel family protein